MPRHRKHTRQDHEMVRYCARKLGYQVSTVWVYLSKGNLLGHKTPLALFNDIDNVEAYVRDKKGRRANRIFPIAPPKPSHWDDPSQLRSLIYHKEEDLLILKNRLKELSE